MDDFKFNDEVWVKDENGEEVARGRIADNFQGSLWIVDIQGRDGSTRGELVSAENMSRIAMQQPQARTGLRPEDNGFYAAPVV